MKKRAFVTSAVSLTLLILSLLWTSPGAAQQSSPGATLTGTVKLSGPVPPTERMEAAVDADVCGKQPIFSEILLVHPKRKGIKNVLVTLTNADRQKRERPTVPGSPVTFDQKGCVFTKHLLVVPVGSTVEFKNSDPVLHNVHTYSRKNSAFNEGIPANGSIQRTFKYAERVKVGCDAHKWMNAYIVVADTPYFAVTNDTGDFSIEGIPPGTYKIRVWQEQLGLAREGPKEIAILAGQDSHVEYTMKTKKARSR